MHKACTQSYTVYIRYALICNRKFIAQSAYAPFVKNAIVANRPDFSGTVPIYGHLSRVPPDGQFDNDLSHLKQNTRSSCVSTRLDGRCSLNCCLFSPLWHSKSVLKQHFWLNFDRVSAGGVVNTSLISGCGKGVIKKVRCAHICPDIQCRKVGMYGMRCECTP